MRSGMVGNTRLVACAAALSILAASSVAAAFCRTLTCELDRKGKVYAYDTDECESDVDPACIGSSERTPLHWTSPCLTYAVQRDGSEDEGIDAATLQQLVADAFAAWEGVTCPGGLSPRFHAQFQGYVGCAQHESVCGGAEQNVNVMMFHDRVWPGMPRAGEIALTRPVAGKSTGRIVDADLELNSLEEDFSVEGTPGRPLSYVLAHEVGHFLGLGHSNQPGSVMAPSYDLPMSGEALLAPDDIAAICAVFPPGPALECREPPPPAYDECQSQVDEQTAAQKMKEECKLVTMTHRHGGGCAFTGAQPGRSAGMLVGLLSLGLFARRRLAQLASRQQRVPVL